MKPILIGLTGQIGAGKSAVSEQLKLNGAVLVDADNIGRTVVERAGQILGQLIGSFGTDILGENGQLDRTRLAELAFVDEESKARLDKIVHPHLLVELGRQIERGLTSGASMVVVDASLLLDWGLKAEMDEVWVVEADQPKRFERLRGRGISDTDALARQAVQPSAEQFREAADRLISNNGSLDELTQQVDQILDSLSGKSTS